MKLSSSFTRCGKKRGVENLLETAQHFRICVLFSFSSWRTEPANRRKKNNKMALSEEQEVVGRAAC